MCAEALKNYDRALKVNPYHVEANINSGVLLYGIGHRGEAFQRFSSALQANPENLIAYDNQRAIQFSGQSNYGWAIDAICRRFFGKINVIFELGSRDALDAIWLGRIFPKASVVAFEANPDSAITSLKNVKNAMIDNVKVVDKAVSDSNSSMTFYPFDIRKYDNIGASSLFQIDFSTSRSPSDPDYGRENPQIEIEVPAVRLDKYCLENRIRQIDILCMDLQGAELLALKGLGKFLASTRYVVSECSHISTYVGGCTFQDIDSILSMAGFSKISHIPANTGYYFDFNFIWENKFKF
jgi:FkbM family methyltransferase